MTTETFNWIVYQIENKKGLVKTKNTREKLIGFLNNIFDFTVENQCITKKDLTQMVNALDKLVGSFYDANLLNIDKYALYDKLAQERGLKNCFDSSNKEAHNIISVLKFLHVYGLSSINHNMVALSKLTLNNSEQKYLNTYYPNMDMWLDLYNKTEEIRSILNPTKEEKEAKRLQEIKGKINVNLKAAIDKIAEDFRLVIEEKHFNHYKNIIVSFKTKYPTLMSSVDLNLELSKNRYFYMKISPFITRNNNIYTLIDNCENKAKELAIKESFEIILKWQMKMYDKLGGEFMNTMQHFSNINVYGNKNHHDISFEFSDGAHFSIRNQIVSKVSNQGTYFHTYPTTFHNAFLADGTEVKSPDEYTVKKAFKDFYNK